MTSARAGPFHDQHPEDSRALGFNGGFRVEGSGLKVEVSAFRVEGLGIAERLFGY